MNKLLSVVVYESEQKLEARVQDPSGKIRQIEVTWLSKGDTKVPDNWREMVDGEVEFQRTEEHNQATGRGLL